MLDKMRQQSKSAIILLLFGFIIFVFVFSFGAGSVGFRTGGCGRTGSAAVVNGEHISDVDFRFHYDQQQRLELAQRGDRTPFRPEDKIQLRQRVVESLIDQALLTQAARRLGLHVTKQERNQAIRSSPQFQDDQQQFNFNLYKMLVQRYYNSNLAVFEEIWQKQMLAQRMAEIIQDTAHITDDELLQTYLTRGTKIDLAFVKVPSAAYQKNLTPSNQEIEDVLNHQSDRLEAFYKSHGDRYHKPKKVQVAHIYFELRGEYDSEQVADKREQAAFTLDDLKKGADFAQQVKEYSEDIATKDKSGELPLLSREAMAARWGAPFAEAAFELAPDSLKGVVKSDKGFHVIKCLKVVEAEDHPLEKVKRDIAKEIILNDRSKQLAQAKARRMLEGLRSGKKFEDLVASPPSPPTKNQKTSPDPQIRRTGMITRLGGFIPQIGVNQELAQAAFALTKEHPFPDRVFELSVDQPTYIVFILADREDPSLEDFSETKNELRTQLLGNRRQRQLTAWLNHQRQNASIQENQAFLMDLTPPGLKRRIPIDDE